MLHVLFDDIVCDICEGFLFEGDVWTCRLSLACQSRNVLRFILFGLLCLVTKRIAGGTAIASGSESITFRKAISNLSTSSSYSEYTLLYI